MIRITRLVALALVVALLAVPTGADARSALKSRTTAKSADLAVVIAAVPCKARCIEYKSHRFLRCKFDPCTAKEIILQVTDPCCCCFVEVPVCVPCCCEGAPEVCTRKGVFGRNVVEYTWCCGYEVKVIFDKCGDVTVHTYGL